MDKVVNFTPQTNFGWMGIVVTSAICLSKSCLTHYSELYMSTVSYFQGRPTLQGTCVLWGYFDILTFGLETMTFIMKMLSQPLLENYKWQMLLMKFMYFCTRFIVNFWKKYVSSSLNLFKKVSALALLRYITLKVSVSVLYRNMLKVHNTKHGT